MIIGIDLSLRSTGIAVVNGDIQTERIETGHTGMTRRKRLHSFTEQIYKHFSSWDTPDLIVIEEPFITQFVKVTSTVHAAVGVLMAAIGNFFPDTPILWVHPMSLKVMVTGYGKASKDDMKAKIEQVTGSYFQDDEADAVALALVGQAVGEIKVECRNCVGGKIIEDEVIPEGGDSTVIDCPKCNGEFMVIPSEIQYSKFKTPENYERILNAFGFSVEGLEELKKQRQAAKKLHSEATKAGMANADKS